MAMWFKILWYIHAIKCYCLHQSSGDKSRSIIHIMGIIDLLQELDLANVEKNWNSENLEVANGKMREIISSMSKARSPVHVDTREEL